MKIVLMEIERLQRKWERCTDREERAGIRVAMLEELVERRNEGGVSASVAENRLARTFRDVESELASIDSEFEAGMGLAALVLCVGVESVAEHGATVPPSVAALKTGVAKKVLALLSLGGS